MTFAQAFILFGAALIGGTLNSIAGGGSFIAFPTLVFTGVPPIQANATTTVALWPGAVTGAWAYRNELNTQKQLLLILSFISMVGGILGAVLLLITPSDVFQHLIPYLMLVATLLFASGGAISKGLKARAIKNKAKSNENKRSGLAITALCQVVISIYGGFFGGGIGILMLAMFAVLGMEDINEMNALKTLLAGLINGVAVFTFIIAGAVEWPQALVMIVGAIVGGYGGAYYARKIDQRYLRGFIIVFGLVVAAYFFVRS